MPGQLLTPNAKSLLAALPDYSILNAAERIQLECAAEGTFSDRGNRPVFLVAALPNRLADVIRAWGRIAPEVVFDEVADAIKALQGKVDA
ncbi:hypothetical protein [Pseudomonas sp. BIC9C]|uniref:hypothetical protein n=1 Tax=Pseudomonas sp. BIC9C TaxID=3078458 RepID=UPI002AD3EE13|nr:hypothetical protein [Pseudomonas sp. BIC9C]